MSTSDQGISRDLYIWRQREPQEVAKLQSLLQPGLTVIDIGANIGFYVVLEAARIGPTGRVYAIEPSPFNVELLRKNIELNRLGDQVTVFQAAVGDQTGQVTLNLSNQSNLNRVHTGLASSDFYDSLKVPCFTLDDLIARQGIDPARVGLLRMDTEGYEVKIIQGMSDTLARARDMMIALEIHPRIIRDTFVPQAYRQMISTLTDNGFKLIWSYHDPRHVTTPVDVGDDPWALLKLSAPFGAIFRKSS